MEKIIIRSIQPADNPHIAEVIRKTLAEFNADKPGTVFSDEATDDLYDYFNKPRADYFIVSMDDKIVGGAGIYPLSSAKEDVCELQRMYLLPNARGKKIGMELVNMCLQFAKANGYKKCYLETMPVLDKAIKIYEQFGFEYLPQRMGETGHFDCDVWMMKEL